MFLSSLCSLDTIATRLQSVLSFQLASFYTITISLVTIQHMSKIGQQFADIFMYSIDMSKMYCKIVCCTKFALILLLSYDVMWNKKTSCCYDFII